MDIKCWNEMKQHYEAAWGWLKGKPTPDFVGLVELYENMSEGYGKRQAFWHSKFWAWLKSNMTIAKGKKCQDCKIKYHYALHHRNKSRYYKPLPEDLELLCADCHNKEHYKGRYSPDFTPLANLKGESMKSLKDYIIDLHKQDNAEIKCWVDKWAARMGNGDLIKDIATEVEKSCAPLQKLTTSKKITNWPAFTSHLFTGLGINENRKRINKKKRVEPLENSTEVNESQDNDQVSQPQTSSLPVEIKSPSQPQYSLSIEGFSEKNAIAEGIRAIKELGGGGTVTVTSEKVSAVFKI